MLKIQRRPHGHPAALGNPAQPRIPALDLQPRIPTAQWPQDPVLLHGSWTQIRSMSEITIPRPLFPSIVKRPGPPFEIQRGLAGIRRGSVEISPKSNGALRSEIHLSKSKEADDPGQIRSMGAESRRTLSLIQVWACAMDLRLKSRA